MQRRAFIRDLAWGGAVLAVAPQLSHTANPAGPPKISLAQWSLNRAFFGGDLDPQNFAAIAMDTYGIDAVEYVSAFYMDSVLDESSWNGLKARATDAGVQSLLIMVDDEGDLGGADDAVRRQAVENHYKWVNAAKILECHSIRVNAFGDPDRETFRGALVDGMGRLAEYAAGEDMDVIIENHGLFSSDAGLITSIITEVELPNLGTLPDFGNWCLSAEWGSTQFECDEVYDRYQGVAELLPYARGVSAKSYNFNEQGEDRIIDYHRMLKIVKDSGYEGYIGIEYEGEEKPEHEGILITRALIEKVWASLP
jgi:sugar phosphate isomerase/epimerase